MNTIKRQRENGLVAELMEGSVAIRTMDGKVLDGLLKVDVISQVGEITKAVIEVELSNPDGTIAFGIKRRKS
ncbi:hypothetical protein [Klebsiella sp. BIGb0407]|uniref:hypothetical protein n=1 Tax=Klebsiella sp. BIGb0407 TaxID=2940603 RepID=UPI002169CE74|nr:hypothetical protein [Klebsiella sp. BIGb0407]MCS3430028.1 hypothetical protein [Klebsiella sp. BIGb0407]